MKTVLFIHGGKVNGEVPTGRFRLRLEWAIAYARHHEDEEVIFFVSGRWSNVMEGFVRSEAEIGRQIIQAELPHTRVIKEDISVELIGNYAFSAPLLQELAPDKVIIVASDTLRLRVKRLSQKIFADKFRYEYTFLQDELSGNEVLIEKDKSALQLFEKLCRDVADGDDAAVRDILLYQTPYYFKGIIDDREFFDVYWPGGFEHFLHGMNTRNSKR